MNYLVVHTARSASSSHDALACVSLGASEICESRSDHTPCNTGGTLWALVTRTVRHTLGLSVPHRPHIPAHLRCACAGVELVDVAAARFPTEVRVINNDGWIRLESEHTPYCYTMTLPGFRVQIGG